MAYPTTIDAPGGTAATGTTLLANVDHALDHRTLGSAVIAIENKLGVGSGSASANQILVGSGAGTATWGTTWNSRTATTRPAKARTHPPPVRFHPSTSPQLPSMQAAQPSVSKRLNHASCYRATPIPQRSPLAVRWMRRASRTITNSP